MEKRMPDRDDEIIEHVLSHRISIRAVLEKLFFETEAAADAVINRLVKSQRLQATPNVLSGNISYYQLTRTEFRKRNLKDKSSQPLTAGPLHRDLAALWFCCMGETKRERLSSDQVEEIFPGLNSQDPHCLEPTSGCFYRMMVPGSGAGSDYILRKLGKALEQVRSNPGAAERFAKGELKFCVLPEPRTKARFEEIIRNTFPDEFSSGSVIVEIAPGPQTLRDLLQDLKNPAVSEPEQLTPADVVIQTIAPEPAEPLPNSLPSPAALLIEPSPEALAKTQTTQLVRNLHPRNIVSPGDWWPPNLPLLYIDNEMLDNWTLEDALGGVIILGTVQSGKTSGPFQYVMRSFLRAGMGGIFFAAKGNAPEQYRQMAAEEGRGEDVIEFGPDHPFSFDFLTYEANFHGSERVIITNIVEYINSVREAVLGSDPTFWKEEVEELIHHSVSVVYGASGGVSLDTLLSVMRELPTKQEHARQFRGRYEIFGLIDQAKIRSPQLKMEIEAAETYFTREFPQKSYELRSGTVEGVRVCLRRLATSPINKLFGAGDQPVTPDDILNGKIVIVDFPMRTYHEAARIGAILWKRALQRAILARPDMTADWNGHVRPIFIAGDEAHNFASPHDVLFTSQAAEYRGITVYATQSIAQLATAMTASREPLATTEALIGNLRNRFVCNLADSRTAEFMAKTLGEIRKKFTQVNTSHTTTESESLSEHSSASDGYNHSNTDEALLGGLMHVPSSVSYGSSHGTSRGTTVSKSISRSDTFGTSTSERLVWDLEPRQFVELRKGGFRDLFKVDAIAVWGNHPFNETDSYWYKTTFDQNLNSGYGEVAIALFGPNEKEEPDPDPLLLLPPPPPPGRWARFVAWLKRLLGISSAVKEP